MAIAIPEDRTAEVRFDKTWLLTPLDWSLYLGGQSVGGYGVLSIKRRAARYGTKARAEAAAAVWIETGIPPAFQTVERIDAARAIFAAADAAYARRVA